jgi:dihydropteroate synthase
MFALVSERGCPLILMHMQGTPQNMQSSPRYAEVVEEVLAYLTDRIDRAVAGGVARRSLMVDPGIGFGKSVAHNCALLRALPRLVRELGQPVVVGISRKSFIGSLASASLQEPLAIHERDAASNAMHALISDHCSLLRVHDVPGARQALQIAEALRMPMVGDGGGRDVD